MSFKFNPFTSNFDLVNDNGGSEIINPAISEFTAFTPSYSTVATYNSTITAVTKATTGISIDEGFWRQVGDSMELTVNYFATNTTGGSETAGIFLVQIPDGHAIDLNKITRVSTGMGVSTGAVNYQGGSSVVGHGVIMNSSTLNNADLTVFAYNANYLSMFVTRSNAWWSTSTVGLRNGGGTISSSFRILVPIDGWTADQESVVMTPSIVHLDEGNGWGTTDTMIRRFTSIRENIGSDITYADSATLGGTFTINTDGIYSIEYSDHAGAVTWFGISLNSSALTTAVDALTYAQGKRSVAMTSLATPCGGFSSATLNLSAGDVIRAHTNGVSLTASNNNTIFRIMRIS